MEEVSLIVTIHKTKKRVLWAEADKDFVDFLFCLFSIPIGQVLNLLNDHESTGCLKKLYESVHAMEKDLMACDKEDILQPKVHLISSSIPSLLKIETNSIAAPYPTYTTLDLYTCDSASCRTFSARRYVCPACDEPVNKRVKHYVSNPNPSSVNNGRGNGFVKGGAVKYIVTDELSVSSKVSFSPLAYLKTMQIVDLNQLDEKVVTVNVEKCKELMKMVLTLNHMVLTNLFKEELGF